MDINFTDRIPDSTDWATLILLLSFVLLVLTKSLFENKFSDFTNIIVSSKYFKIYRDSNNLMSWFNILLVIVHLFSFSFFIHLVLSYFILTEKNNWEHYGWVGLGLFTYVLFKYLIDKIISFTFEIDEFYSFYNLQKVTYKNLIGILFIPINIIFFYNDSIPYELLLGIICLFFFFNLFSYLNILRTNSKTIIENFFYFFLYLCALEIAPYFVVSYWFIKLTSI